MRVPFILLFFGLACASNPGFKDNTEYVYLINGRTLTSLQELSEQYSGIFLRAKLHVIPGSNDKLWARISETQYAQVHSELSNGWETNVPESMLNYKPLGFSDKYFQIVAKDGLVQGLILEKDVANWEANVIKSFVSQLQLDLQGNNAVSRPINNIPHGDKIDGMFVTMEDTITGKTETTYDVHMLPEYLVQSKPWLVPHYKLKGDGEVIEVMKNKNYTNCQERPAYHYGFGELTEGSPTANQVGTLLTRQSNSRVILTGKLSKYTIQSSQTVNKIMVNPTGTSIEHGSVVSFINLTLSEVKTQGQQPQELSNPVDIGNLVYSYDAPFARTNEVRQKLESSSSSDSSSEESDEQFSQKGRRYADPLVQRLMGQPGRKENFQYQPRPSMTNPQENPLLPYYVGYHGRAITANSDFDIKQNIERLAKEISEELQEPEKILTQSTLSRFSLMTTLVRLLGKSDIGVLMQMLYTQEKTGQNRITWTVLRDALAEAGTGPAFLNIKELIESNMLEKEEAAEVIASVAHSVRAPTEEYMRTFFEFVKKPSVANQEYVNDTALLSFTRLVQRVYVSRNQSQNNFPVHSFKNFNTEEGRSFVVSSIVPYLREQLDLAISQADTRKIHVYIRALGNVGHRRCLEAFEPYLEGQKQASQFQRMLMVLSMDRLIDAYPSYARSVLYKIYSNTGEVPEVRTVAVYQLMRTNPPAEWIQRMAENTNEDPQEQVAAVVKQVIESASKLKGHAARELAQKAQMAKPLLTKREFGNDQSANWLQAWVVEKMNIEFKNNFLKVASSDDALPKGAKYSVRGNISGMKYYFLNVQALVSSVQELTNVLSKQSQEYQRASSQKTQRKTEGWSSEKIAEILNLETTQREQLEGFLYSEIEAVQKIFSFDNSTIEQLPEAIYRQEQLLQNGKTYQYTKLKQLKEMALSIPTEMGLPFLYTFDVPSVQYYKGSIKAVATPKISSNNKLRMPNQISAEVDGFVTAGAKVEAHLSIVTPFDHQVYIAGYDKNAQLHCPVKAKVELDTQKMQATIETEIHESHKDARLFHYSSWPYTSRGDLMTIEPVALRPHTYHMNPEKNTHRKFDFTLGKGESGLALRVWGYHPNQFDSLPEITHILKPSGFATLWQNLWDGATLQNTQASIALLPGQSSSRKIVLHLGYQERNQITPKEQQQEQLLSLRQLSDKLQGGLEERQNEMLNYVGSGINNAKCFCLDASVEFQGGKTIKHFATVAAAKSNVLPHGRMAAVYKNNAERPTEASVQLKGYIPNADSLDLSHSLKSEPQAKYDVRMEYGVGGTKPSTIKASVNMNRSEARKQHLLESPLYHVCKKQMQEGNNQLHACQNMTNEANYMDDINIKLHYENYSKGSVSGIENLFKGIRFWYYPMTEIKPIKADGENEINVRVNFEPERLRQVNLTVRTEEEETRIYNVSLSHFYKTLLVPNPVYNLKARMFAEILGEKRDTCVVDQTAAQTFSNKIYPLSLSKGWTVMMQYIPQEAGSSQGESRQPAEQLRQQLENFAVLVRASKSQAEQKECLVAFSHPLTHMKNIEINMVPKPHGSNPKASILVDGQDVQFSDKQSANLFNGLVEVFSLPNGEIKMLINDWFQVTFDGQRVKITSISSQLRDSVVGLCGRYSRDQFEDFWTPKNCIVKSPQKFAESFIVEQNHRQMNAAEEDCISKDLPLYRDVITDYDVKRVGRNGGNQNQMQSSNDMKRKSRYVEQNDEICFTIQPIPVCKNLARTTITKSIPVHCVAKSKTANYLKKQIDQGGNPDFGHKSQTRSVEMEIPQNCY